MNFNANCQTTAMGNLPHTDPEAALSLALSLDVPFFPQLPRLMFQEDLYVISSENFPGIKVDFDHHNLSLDTVKFYNDLPEFLDKFDSEEYFMSSRKYSQIYNMFLSRDLTGYSAIRGQTMGPMSFGFRVFDENKKPIIYNDSIREVLFSFFANKVNVQLRQLREKNKNVFIWLDEPGLEMLFACYTGYTNLSARTDYQDFLSKIDGQVGIHLCGNPDWSFLLSDINIKMLSINAYGCGSMFTKYYEEINTFLDKGNIIAWGIVPTLKKQFEEEDINKLEIKLEAMWNYLASKGIEKNKLLKQSLLTPSSCCMVNNDGGKTVEESFKLLKALSARIRAKYSLE